MEGWWRLCPNYIYIYILGHWWLLWLMWSCGTNHKMKVWPQPPEVAAVQLWFPALLCIIKATVHYILHYSVVQPFNLIITTIILKSHTLFYNKTLRSRLEAEIFSTCFEVEINDLTESAEILFTNPMCVKHNILLQLCSAGHDCWVILLLIHYADIISASLLHWEWLVWTH